MLGPDDAVAAVGDGDSVDAPGVVGCLRALGIVVGLLARLRTADVDAVHIDRRHRLHHDPGIAGAWDLLQFQFGHMRCRCGATYVDNRSPGRDVYGFRGAGKRELHGKRRARTAEDFDVAAGGGCEAGQRHTDGVDAHRQIQEVSLALRVGDLRLGRHTFEGHARTGQPGAAGVLNRDVDASGEYLRARRRREVESEHPHRSDCGRSGPTHHVQRLLESRT